MNAPLPSSVTSRQSDHIRPWLIAGAGVVIILISLAAALLPLADGYSRASVIGAMMIVAGLVEMVAGSVRRQNRLMAMLSGAATVAVGLLFTREMFSGFVPTVRLVMVWLVARGTILAFASLDLRGSVRLWTVLAAGTDLSLSAILLIGLSATTITITFFGATSEIISSFAWVLALSFVATGSLLLEVAASEGR